MKRRSLRWRWHLPTRFELLLIVLAGLCLIVFDYAQNFYQIPSSIHAITLFGVEAITLFWVFFLLYTVFIVWLFVNAIKGRGTGYIWDWVFGTMAIVGLMFILIGGIGAIYYRPSEGLPFFYNFAQISVYHFGGVLLQLIALGYFFLTQ